MTGWTRAALALLVSCAFALPGLAQDADTPLVAELIDGSRLRCTAGGSLTLILADQERTTVPLARIRLVRFAEGTALITTNRGTAIVGRPTAKSLIVDTVLGPMTLPLAKLRTLARAGVTIPAAPAAFAEGRPRGRIAIHKGLTWVVKKELRDLVLVGGDKTSQAYRGDTPASRRLPILAIRKTGLARPAYLPKTNRYQTWSGAEVKLTAPVQGHRLLSLAAANTIVEAELGKGWRMASFHDGWAWNFWARGKLPRATRFWVYIRDQRANCWNAIQEPQKQD